MGKYRERERLVVAKHKGEGKIESEYYEVQGFFFFLNDENILQWDHADGCKILWLY